MSLPLKKSIKKDQELIVITKTYDLILWSCNHTGKFPRNHRFVLGERIERNDTDPSLGASFDREGGATDLGGVRCSGSARTAG
jgi:hypothetical protein